MMFRKLYWVSERVENDGTSKVSGVYTSIPDLIRRGLHHGDSQSLRLTLTKLDCDKDPIGSWISPKFDGLEQGLQEFIRTDEFSAEQCNALIQALTQTNKIAV